MHSRSSILSASIIACLMAVAPITNVRAQDAISFDLPAQPLVDSLKELASQSNLNVFFEPNLVAGVQAPALQGMVSAQEALHRLLKGSGLTYRAIDDRTLAVVADVSNSRSLASKDGAAPIRLAQSTPVAAPRQRVASSDSASDSTIHEVIVTAQKREERLQDVPISISVLDDEITQRAAITRVTDLEKLVPNVAFESAYGASQENRITIRGITGNVRNAGFESGVSVYVDGVYVGRPAAQNLNLTNIERVEVLRGPQGTLFGKNTIAGVVNVITKKPSDELDGKIAVNLGNFGRSNFNGHVSGPVVDDSLYFGASFFSNDRDGYVKNLFDGRDIGNEANSGGDIKLRFLPNEDLEVNFRVDYFNDDSLFLYPEPFDGTSTIGDGIVYSPGIRTVNMDGIPSEQRESYGASLTLDYSWGDSTLTSISAYHQSEFRHAEDNDDAPLDSLFVAGWHEESQYASQEFRLASPTSGRFDYIVGAYLYWQDVVSDVPFRLGNAYPGGPGLSVVYSDIQSTGAAVFVHSNYHFTDRLTLTAGLRYTNDRKEVKDYRATSVGPFEGLFDFPSFKDKRTDSDVSPMVSLGFAISDEMTTYAKVARGFKAGGWNTDYVAAGPNGTPPPASTLDFDPEYATTYEVGFKGSLLDRRLMLNVAAFYTDYEDLQVQSRVFDTQSNLFLFEFNNAATSTIEGVEVDAMVQVTDGFSIRAGVGYTDAVYESFKGASVINGVSLDYDGNRLPHAPKWNSSVMLTYERPISGDKNLSISVDHSFKDSFFTDAANDPDLEVESRSLVGGRIGIVSPDHWEVFLWGENLTNQDYLITKQKGTGNLLRVTWGMPRSYGVQLGYSF